jgi:hypothetical protein
MPITPDDTLYTAAEAAAMLGITRSALSHALKRGAIRAVEVHAHAKFFTLAEIERYRAENLGRHFGHDPNKPATKGAEYSRAYRERLKARRQAEQATAQQSVEPPATPEGE